MWCGPWAAIDSTSLLRDAALPAGDTNEGEASTVAREPAWECRSTDGVDEPCRRRRVISVQR